MKPKVALLNNAVHNVVKKITKKCNVEKNKQNKLYAQSSFIYKNNPKNSKICSQKK